MYISLFVNNTMCFQEIIAFHFLIRFSALFAKKNQGMASHHVTNAKKLPWTEVRGPTAAEEEPPSPSTQEGGGGSSPAKKEPPVELGREEEEAPPSKAGVIPSSNDAVFPFLLSPSILAVGGQEAMTLELLGAEDPPPAQHHSKGKNNTSSASVVSPGAKPKFLRESLAISDWSLIRCEAANDEQCNDHQENQGIRGSRPGPDEDQETATHRTTNTNTSSNAGATSPSRARDHNQHLALGAVPMFEKVVQLEPPAHPDASMPVLPPTAVGLTASGHCYVAALVAAVPENTKEKRAHPDDSEEEEVEESQFQVIVDPVTRVPKHHQSAAVGGRGTTANSRATFSALSHQTHGTANTDPAHPIRMCRPGAVGFAVASTGLCVAPLTRPTTAATTMIYQSSMYGGSAQGGSKPPSRAGTPATGAEGGRPYSRGSTPKSFGVGGDGDFRPITADTTAGLTTDQPDNWMTTTVYSYGGWSEDSSGGGLRPKLYHNQIYKTTIKISMEEEELLDDEDGYEEDDSDDDIDEPVHFDDGGEADHDADIDLLTGRKRSKGQGDRAGSGKKSNSQKQSQTRHVLKSEAISVKTLPSNGLMLPPSTGFHSLSSLSRPTGSTSDSHSDRLILFGGFLDAQWKPKLNARVGGDGVSNNSATQDEPYRVTKMRELRQAAARLAAAKDAKKKKDPQRGSVSVGDPEDDDGAARPTTVPTQQQASPASTKRKNASSASSQQGIMDHSAQLQSGGIVAIDDNFGDERILKPEPLDPFHQGQGAQPGVGAPEGPTSGTTMATTLFCGNGTYLYEAGSWQKVKCLGEVPTGRANHSAAVSGDYLLIAGGTGDQGAHLMDVYALHLGRRIWLNLDFCPSPSAGLYGGLSIYATATAIWCVAGTSGTYIAVTPKNVQSSAILTNKLRQITTNLLNSASSGDPALIPPTVTRHPSEINQSMARLVYDRSLPLEIQDRRRQNVQKQRDAMSERPDPRLLRLTESGGDRALVPTRMESMISLSPQERQQKIDEFTLRLHKADWRQTKENKQNRILNEKAAARQEERLRTFGLGAEVRMEEDVFVRRFHEAPVDHLALKKGNRERALRTKGPKTIHFNGNMRPESAMIEQLFEDEKHKKRIEHLYRKMGLQDLAEEQRKQTAAGRAEFVQPLPPLRKKKMTETERQEANAKVGHRAQSVMARLTECDEKSLKIKKKLYVNQVPSPTSFQPKTTTKAWERNKRKAETGSGTPSPTKGE